MAISAVELAETQHYGHSPTSSKPFRVCRCRDDGRLRRHRIERARLHDEVVARIGMQPGERLLDVGPDGRCEGSVNQASAALSTDPGVLGPGGREQGARSKRWDVCRQVDHDVMTVHRASQRCCVEESG
jgi:hypothetical protein